MLQERWCQLHPCHSRPPQMLLLAAHLLLWTCKRKGIVSLHLQVAAAGHAEALKQQPATAFDGSTECSAAYTGME